MSRRTASYVPPAGPLNATIMLVGEQPGKMEVYARRPFAGPAGEELNSCLHSAGLSRGECYITNTIKDLDVPVSEHLIYSRQTPVGFTNSGKEYLDLLKGEITTVNPNVIVAIGAIAFLALTERTGVTKWRGSFVPSTLVWGKKVIPTLHPATVIPPKNQYLNRYLIIQDLKRALEWSHTPEMPTYNDEFLLRPSFTATLSFLDECLRRGLKGAPIAWDIEVDIHSGEITCISLAYSPTECICIPFVCEQGDYFPLDQESVIWQAISRIMEDPLITKIGQNIIFDSHFLLRKFGIKSTNLHDTMIAQKLLYPDFPVGLHFIQSMYTLRPYHKDDGKRHIKVGGEWNKFYVYNCLDSVACHEAFGKQTEGLIELGNLTTYERQRRLIPPLTYMMERGIKVDMDGLLSHKERNDAEISRLSQELNALAGRDLNWNSPKQLKEYLYDHKGYHPYKKRDGTGGWTVTTDDNAMMRLARTGVKEAQIIRDIRKLGKENSVYLNPSKIDKDGRYRSSYNPVGTETGRLSSSENIFGTGGNQQNWPHHLLSYLIPDDGYIYFGLDLSQAENRLVAYGGNITPMIEAFENGVDVHKKTASLLYGVPMEEITPEQRQMGKKCVAGTTEILTPKGWVPIRDWNYKNTEVAQWDKATGEITFVIATNLSVYHDNVIELSGRNAHVVGTHNHKVLTHRSDQKQYKIYTLAEVPNSSHYGIPTCGKWGYSDSIMTSAEVRLLVAFQADGAYNHKSHRFKFTKRKKVDRIKDILNDLSIPFNESEQGDGSISIGFRGPAWLTKTFDSRLLGLGFDEMLTFIGELHHWDGHIRTNGSKQYFSTIEDNVKWAQTIAHLCGYTALIHRCEQKGFGTKPIYIMKYNNRNTRAMLVSMKKRFIEEPTTVYGPEVPSGYFLIRSEGRISVTGNSNHGLNYGEGFKTFSITNDITEKQGKWVVDRYHMAYPGVRQGFHTMIQLMLRRNRVVTNVMGRKRIFLDQWGEKLLMAAYAHFPQSTVADIINERGIDYIWRDQETFAPLELLNQIHDSIGFQLPLSIGWERMASILLKVKSSLETPLSWESHTFTIPVDITMNLTLGKKGAHEFKGSRIPTDPQSFALQLKLAHETLTGEKDE